MSISDPSAESGKSLGRDCGVECALRPARRPGRSEREPVVADPEGHATAQMVEVPVRDAHVDPCAAHGGREVGVERAVDRDVVREDMLGTEADVEHVAQLLGESSRGRGVLWELDHAEPLHRGKPLGARVDPGAAVEARRSHPHRPGRSVVAVEILRGAGGQDRRIADAVPIGVHAGERHRDGGLAAAERPEAGRRDREPGLPGVPLPGQTELGKRAVVRVLEIGHAQDR